MPSREKLRAFVNHVRTLTQKDENGDDGFDREYKSIKDLQQQIKDTPEYPVDVGRLPCNKKKNRYKDILPFDFCRVALTPTNDEGGDYINASFLQDVNGENGYIAAMGPLTATVNDFWRMLWDYGIKTIVMVCKEVELGKKKCAKYWADTVDEPVVQHAGLTITVVEEKQIEEIMVRVLDAECAGERRRLYHYHFQSWPDHGVPESAQPIVDLIQIFRSEQPINSPPIVVHCSAGCGRTGTVCAVDYAWQLLESQIDSDVSVLDIVTLFRHQRLSMVQTKDQYVLIYKAVLKLVKSYLASKSKSTAPAEAAPAPARKEDLYENVSVQGGLAYGQQTLGLEPKTSTAPAPPTKRTPPPSESSASLTVTNIDDVTMTPEEQEEEIRLLQQMTASSKHRPTFLQSYPDEEEDEENPPPIPVHTEAAAQLEDSTVIDERFAGTEGGMYAAVSPTPSGRNSRADLQAEFADTAADAAEHAPAPSRPTRTSDSYILAEGPRQVAAQENAVPPALPTSPRPNPTSSLSPPQPPLSSRQLSTSSSDLTGSPLGRPPTPSGSAGTSSTLPGSGRHAQSSSHNTSPPASDNVMASTKKVFSKLVNRGRNTTKNTPPSPVTISSPVGIGTGANINGGGMNVSREHSHHPPGSTVPVFSEEMGFRNRVRQPKGPRNMPVTWRQFA